MRRLGAWLALGGNIFSCPQRQGHRPRDETRLAISRFIVAIENAMPSEEAERLDATDLYWDTRRHAELTRSAKIYHTPWSCIAGGAIRTAAIILAHGAASITCRICITYIASGICLGVIKDFGPFWFRVIDSFAYILALAQLFPQQSLVSKSYLLFAVTEMCRIVGENRNWVIAVCSREYSKTKEWLSKYFMVLLPFIILAVMMPNTEACGVQVLDFILYMWTIMPLIAHTSLFFPRFKLTYWDEGAIAPAPLVVAQYMSGISWALLALAVSSSFLCAIITNALRLEVAVG